ncbi:MAG: hypothetical protein HZC24_11435 [Rhodocyclales bacterium]|nr:hypothetical protein [Rhodocyclales bacterium]
MSDNVFGFLAAPPDPAMLYFGHYQPSLVLASFGIAVFASFASFEVAARMRSAHNETARRNWLAVGALTLGVGIWACWDSASVPCTTSA